MEAVLEAFIVETKGLLDRLEDALLHLERSPHALVEVDEAFRAAHTLKGNARVVDNVEIEWFAHVMESVLERVRGSTLAVNAHLVSTLLACADHMRFLVGLVALDETSPDFAQEDRARLIGELVPYLGGEIAPVESESAALGSNWLLAIRFSSDVMRQGMDPACFLRYLESIGRIVALRVIDSELPEPPLYDPELCYLRFEVELETTADKQAIEDIFACVRESCELRIWPPRARIQSYAESIRALPDSELRMGEMLVRVGALTADELAGALRTQRVAPDEKVRPIGSILVDEGYVPPELVQVVASRQAEIRARMEHESETLKVAVARVDELVSLLEGLSVGLARQSVPRELAAQAAAALSLALSMRSVQVADCFARLDRVVRDQALELGKEIDLQLFGGELRIDRALAETLAAAVMHLVRNAVDHGIEDPAQRLRLGKPRRGTLHLSLEESPAGLLLELADDGCGIDSQQLLQSARQRGLLDVASAPDRDTLLAVIFEPGFSTRAEVGRYSGRGVGLDAVSASVQALGGKIRIASEPARGTRFTIQLPARATLSASTHQIKQANA